MRGWKPSRNADVLGVDRASSSLIVSLRVVRMTRTAAAHHQVVVDQFGKQAACFARLPGHEEATRLLIETAEFEPNDDVLDVACGPGLVACAVARHVRHVAGIDLTPAMIEQARELQSRLGLSNLEWHTGDAAGLPFATNRFSAALTRYSLHHVLDPLRFLSEMVRVVRPGGRVVVADLILPAEQGAPTIAWNGCAIRLMYVCCPIWS